MQLDAILIPATTTVASNAARVAASASSSFGAALASSMHTTPAEYSAHQSVEARGNANPKSESEYGVKSGEKYGKGLGSISSSGAGSKSAAGVNSLHPNLNSRSRSKANAKSGSKSDAKPSGGDAAAVGGTPSASGPLPNPNPVLPSPLTTMSMAMMSTTMMMSGAGQAAPSASGSSNVANLSNPSSGPQLVQNAANPVDPTNFGTPASGEIGVQVSGNAGPLSSDVPMTAFAAPAQSSISSAAADAAGLASTAAVAPPASSAVPANQAAKDNLPIAQFAALQSDGVMAAVTPTLSAGASLVASGALSSDRSNSFLKSSEPKAGDSTTNKSAPGSLAVVGITAVGRAGADGSAALAKAGVLDATLQTAQEIANNAVSSSPQHRSPGLADVPASGATAASTADVRNSAEGGISGTSVSSSSVSLAAVEKTVGDKKSSGSAIPAAASSIGSSTAAGASLVTLSAPSVPAAALPIPNSPVPGRDLSVTLTAPTQATVAVASQATSNNAAGELPKAHQMLDSASPAPAAPPPAPIASGPAAESQMNGQMHVGVRSDAFGTIDIHTVVQQSQVGITVHSERDMAHWFSAEVAGLESGLNKSHLNLTGVSFDSGSSGMQSGSSFQHDGQPRQSFSQDSQPSTTLPGQPTATESAGKNIGPPDPSTLETVRSGSPAASGKIHVSIHA